MHIGQRRSALCSGGRCARGEGLLLHALASQPRQRAQGCGEQEEDQVGHAGDETQDADDGPGQDQDLRIGEQLPDHQPADVTVVTDA